VVVPLTPDGRLSAKDVFNPKTLRALQTEYAEAMKPFAMQRDGIGVQATYQKEKLQAVVFEYEGQHLKGSELGRAYSGNNLAKTIEAQQEQVQQQRAELSTAGQQYGQHRLELDLEAFGREYAAQKQQAEKAEKQAQERTAPQQTPKPQPPTIKRSGGYEMGD
jgi:hypothetical protein